MPKDQTHPEHKAIIWTGVERGDLIERVIVAMPNIKVIAVGGPKRAPAGELADAIGATDAPIYDDLRKMLIDHTADFLVLATGAGVSIDALRVAEKQAVQVLSINPPTDDLNYLPDSTPEPGRGRWWWPMPSWQLSPAWLSAAEPQQELTPVKSMSIVMLGPPEAGSLYARLYDAFDMILTLCGMPIVIDASLVSPLGSPPPNLRELTGHLTAMIKLPKQCTATIHASDTSVQWSRRVHCLGEAGQLYLADTSYRLWNAQAQLVDSLDTNSLEPPTAAALIISQWQRMIEHRITAIGPDPRQVIACCQAALLSARTGTQESPESMLRLAGL